MSESLQASAYWIYITGSDNGFYMQPFFGLYTEDIAVLPLKSKYESFEILVDGVCHGN